MNHHIHRCFPNPLIRKLSLRLGRVLLCPGMMLLLALCFSPLSVAAEPIWTLGSADDKASEFALAPGQFEDFLNHDFGWEDRNFVVGQATIGTDWPYVLPGPADAWAGSGGLAGTRTQVLNLLFDLANKPKGGSWTLTIDLVDVHPTAPPHLKVIVNGRHQVFPLQPGGGEGSIRGDLTRAREQVIQLELPSEALRQGGNHIALTVIQGSWLIFDQVRLDGPHGAQLAPAQPIFIRNIEPAAYEISINDKRWQPLLVDLETFDEGSLLEVLLDDAVIFSARPKKGRSILETPMPPVSQSTESRYAVRINGRTVRSGSVQRARFPLITPADYADPLLGSAHSRWMIAPGPWMPFGMVKLSPDNQNGGWQAGYDPHIENVAGFSHIHEWTMSGLLTMPTTGPLRLEIGDQYQPDQGYRSRIDKSSEEARIGYYRVHLSDYDIDAELTATTRASLQRYTFPRDEMGRVLLDFQFPAEYSFAIDQVDVRRVSPTRIEGSIVQNSPRVWSNDAHQFYTVHFVAEFDHPMTSFGTWTDQGVQRGQPELHARDAKDAGAFAEFDTRVHPVIQMRCGISLVSVANAASNLEKEITQPFGWNFEAVRHHHKAAWNDLLNRVSIETPDRREKIRFYSNLYRSFCARNTWSDANGQWLDPNEELRQLERSDDVMLGCDAFWNTFWNLNQVWNLVTPEWSARWVRSQLALYEATGWLAKGPAGLEYIPVMVAEHEIALIVAAYQMGIRDFNIERAFEAVHHMQTTPARTVAGGLAGNRDLETYLKHRYVPADKGRASNTLEYAFDDWAVSQFAEALGKTDLARQFKDRSTWWRNMFDSETGFARLRNADGQWVEPFDPYRSGANEEYVEGNAWQLTFFVPQDLPGLIDVLGRDRFLSRLEKGFTRSALTRFNAPNEQYWDYPVVHGNQQSMHFAFLFNWAQAPWLTQKWSREVLNRYYGYGTGDAYLGDEDQGQMSAWFIMAALGLFQMDGGCRVEPIYEIGSPLFPKTVIDLGQRAGRGKTFTIVAKDVSDGNRYVQSARLNGKPLNRWWFPARELLKGGELVLQMGPQPNKNWGISP